ncbi:MAG: metallophosphoesterase [Actinomycetota bacterium]|nr:metallophosphoesterase [Actinomycetota bacterium]
MTRILAIADEVDNVLYSKESLGRLNPHLVVACGDLPGDYLEYIVTMSSVPLVFVPGNHDPDLSRPRPEEELASFTQPFGFDRANRDTPGPAGCINADGRILEAAGVVIAGLGGSYAYNFGPNQYTESQMRRRTLRLQVRDRLRRARNRRPIDLLITHAPPRGLGDEGDLAHRGFACFHPLVRSLGPELLAHGHIHLYGRQPPTHRLADTEVVNVVGHRLLELSR